MSDDDQRPSVAVVLAGGFGVAAVVAFVAVVLFGATSDPRPGDRVDVVRQGARLVVVAGRCADQRVTSVALESADGDVWRITSPKGSIERVYPAGDAPFGFTTATPLRDVPAGRLRVTVGFDREGEASTDGLVVDTRDLPAALPRLDDAAPSCGSRRLRPGAVTALIFAAGAAAVVGGYVVMLVRFARGK